MNTFPANEPSPGLLAPLSNGLPSMPLLDRATEQAGAMARRGVDAMRDTSQQMRDAAWRASDRTASLVRNEPLKSMLIAAVAGAALMALLGLLTRTRA
jgi:ElaB/YqjD/DUF883 family membrane-anchored ribosome-binding protein